MTVRELSDRIQKRTRKAGVSLDPQLIEPLCAYYNLLEFWNEKINLTAFSLKDAPDDAIDRLLIEPLVAAKHMTGSHHSHGRLAAGERPVVLDIGSGGGSPALPLKLAIPGMTLRMVESKTRKSAFLREAVRVLSLTNAEVETARAEELLTRPELHESQDFVTVRAVRLELKLLVKLQAFLKTGGRILMFRSGTGSDAPPTVVPPLVYEATLPLVDSLRSRLVVLRKML
ncbi:MAG: 16S rRNA (guanine(527)-N(7))-methyltransferase RsmG [Vicinamibacterales bacterium]|nr:16S rRNA (guanine(527)-N(7))-methyltransferase RsmG [Vicinamibacterales bacterium]